MQDDNAGPSCPENPPDGQGNSVAPMDHALVPGSGALGETLTWKLHRLDKLIEPGSTQAYLRHAGLTLGEGRCFAAVGSFGPLSVNLLAQSANLDKANASRAAQSLVRKGLIQRSGRSDDRRVVLLALSPQGHDLWQRTMAMILERNAAIFGVLGPQGQQQLRALLDAVMGQW